MVPLNTKATSSTRFSATVITSVFLMGSSFPVSRVLLDAGTQPLPLVALRFFSAACIATLIAYVFMNTRTQPAETRQVQMGAVVVGILQTGCVMSLIFIAIQTVDPAVVAAILFSNVLVVAAVDAIAGRRHWTPTLIASLALGVSGLTLVTGTVHMILATTNAGTSYFGEWLSVGAACCWSSATLISKHFKPVNTWRFNNIQMFSGAAIVAITAWLQGDSLWLPTDTASWAWFLWLTIPASIVSFGLWFSALHQRSASETSAWLFLVPVFAALISWPINGIMPTITQTFGAALIGLALFLQGQTHK